jgi:hypothetical protein
MGVETVKGIFIQTLEDVKADFKQYVEFKGQKLQGRVPRFKPSENETLTGEKAMLRLLAYTGLGNFFEVPLWHTGIWVVFKTPTESAVLELHRQLLADKVYLGRATHGLVFSHVVTYTVDRLVNFALNHIYATTLEVPDGDMRVLKDIISCQDIQTLLWGLACALYPNGFQYRRPCINEPEKCTFVVEELLDPKKLIWVNNAALTEWQKTHMSERRPKSKKLETITRYKEELLCTQNRSILLNHGTDKELRLTQRSPSINDYVQGGHRWISGIVTLVDQVLAAEPNSTERESLIERHSQATFMRQYDHWVHSIEMVHGGNLIEDRETLEMCLNVLNSNETFLDEFMKATVEYIQESTITVIGIPVFDCPKCKTPQTSPLDAGAFKNIIPLDVVQLFFTLISLKMEKLKYR